MVGISLFPSTTMSLFLQVFGMYLISIVLLLPPNLQKFNNGQSS
jgi:hypothetical protein